MCSQTSVRTPNLKFQGNSSGCPMWTDGRTDMAKVGRLRNCFANAPKLNYNSDEHSPDTVTGRCSFFSYGITLHVLLFSDVSSQMRCWKVYIVSR